jgi:hypothetical protein
MVWKFLVPPHFPIDILFFDEFFDNFGVRDHGGGGVGHDLRVQDAPSLIQKYLNSTHVWALFKFVCISQQWLFLSISMVWPFPGFLVPTMTSAPKNQDRQPRFRVHLSQFDAVYIQSNVVSWTKDNY